MRAFRWHGIEYEIDEVHREVKVLHGNGKQKREVTLTRTAWLTDARSPGAIAEDSEGSLYRLRGGRGWTEILQPVRPEARQLLRLVERWKEATR